MFHCPHWTWHTREHLRTERVVPHCAPNGTPVGEGTFDRNKDHKETAQTRKQKKIQLLINYDIRNNNQKYYPDEVILWGHLDERLMKVFLSQDWRIDAQREMCVVERRCYFHCLPFNSTFNASLPITPTMQSNPTERKHSCLLRDVLRKVNISRIRRNRRLQIWNFEEQLRASQRKTSVANVSFG